VRTPETAGTVIAIVGTDSSTVFEDFEGGIQMSDFDDIIKSRLDPRAVVREEVSTEDGESLLNKVEVDKLDRGFRVLKKRRDIAYLEGCGHEYRGQPTGRSQKTGRKACKVCLFMCSMCRLAIARRESRVFHGKVFCKRHYWLVLSGYLLKGVFNGFRKAAGFIGSRL